MKKDMLLAIGVGKPSSEYPEFPIPEGMDLADLKEGDEKEVVAKVKKKGDSLCLVSVDGVALGKDEEETESEDYPEEESAEMPEAPMDQSAAQGLSARASAAGLM